MSENEKYMIDFDNLYDNYFLVGIDSYENCHNVEEITMSNENYIKPF